MTALGELVRHDESGSRGGVLKSGQAIRSTKAKQLPCMDRPREAVDRRLPRTLRSRSSGMFVAGILGAAGAFFAAQALLLDLGGIASPGPGFLPFLLGASIMLCAALIGIDCWRSVEGEAVEFGHRDVVITIAALLAVPLIFERLGAYISLALFGIAILILVGRIAPLLAIAATIVGLTACWYFFQVLLGVQLPTGPW
jgi:hypothetical protein